MLLLRKRGMYQRSKWNGYHFWYIEMKTFLRNKYSLQYYFTKDTRQLSVSSFRVKFTFSKVYYYKEECFA